jgi:hypothetical protein
VHQDSQHVSAALWKARADHFQGTDNGHTYDAAFYAALVAMSPTVDFAQVAAIVTAHVKDAFPTITDAETKIQAIFNAKGVINCDKVIDLSTAATTRPMYAIGQRSGAGVTSGILPGPYQMKFKTPQGAKSVSFSAQAGGGIPGLGNQIDVRLLAKSGGPITFTKAGSALNNDSDKAAQGTVSGSTVSAKVDIDVPCGANSELDFTIGTNADNGVSLQDVVVSFEQAVTCNPVTDGGTDAGTNDGGTGTKYVPAVQDNNGGAVAQGCYCGAGGGAPALLGMVLLALRGALRRRVKKS